MTLYLTWICAYRSQAFRQRSSSTAENPTGERRKVALRVAFDGGMKLAFHGARNTSDGGLPANCELDAETG